jgi:hypothetical protein
MWYCDYQMTVDFKLLVHQGETNRMKKIMSLMLGLSLLTGAVAFAAGKDTTKSTTKTTKKGGKKKSTAKAT